MEAHIEKNSNFESKVPAELERRKYLWYPDSLRTLELTKVQDRPEIVDRLGMFTSRVWSSRTKMVET